MSTPLHQAKNAVETAPRRALILAGGGMRVAYQAGVLRALDEFGLTFGHADGTSGGTINLAMWLSGISPTEMCDRWRTLDVTKFASLLPVTNYLAPTQLIAVGDADGIVGHVFPHLGIDVDKIKRSTGVQGTFNVCNYTDKTAEVIPHQELTRDLLVAGISLPIFMPPLEHNGRQYLDAVWIRDANLMEAVRRGADELWVVWCIGNHEVYRRGAFQQYVHMIELSANGALFGEFERIEEINARIQAGERVGGRTRPIRLHLIKPEFPLPLDPDFFLGRIDASTLIAMGYADARAYLRTMKTEGLPFEPQVTKMKRPGLGLSFRETMAGDFSLRNAAPATAQGGGATRARLAMHASITIQNLDAFLADPQHQGHIDGTVDFPPFGSAIPAESGVFKLFCPTDDPQLWLMVYEIGFRHQGRSYYLAGHKNVRVGSIFRLWPDTTTLFTTLHEGVDKSGPVIGEGVLSLGPIALLKMVMAMSALNSPSFFRSIGTVARFGAFFARELWRVYVRKG